jgi:tRNA A-37 threonylcarbamoyl transferase component Bud32/CheY-like chemotaxis protein
MADIDANIAAHILLKTGLVTEAQLDEVWNELGGKGGDADKFLYVLERKGYITPWQTSKVLKGDTEGYILGGYKVLYKIQSGSFGRVFRAQDVSSGRVVAIKVLRRRWSEDQQRIDLFLREGRVGMALHHPNIVEVLNVNVERATGQYYLVMEFIEGGNLREILALNSDKKLAPLKAVRITEDCASALAYAYAQGVTHRDMKLTNILISSQGVAKLVDFGLARIYSKLAGTDEEKVERTVDYAGLERATGVKSGDVRSDIYFLGCVLYEMLAGRPPLDMSRDKHQRMQKHRFDSAKPLTRADVDAPPSVFHLVETMTELDPTRRYQTPAQLLDAVKAVRRELESKEKGGAAAKGGPKSVFVVESDLKLQDALREKLKEIGYKVFIAADPIRALDRFRQQPFEGLVVDARTTGEEGLLVLDQIATEADRQSLPCGAILLLDEEQADLARRVKPRPTVAVLAGRITLKKLTTKLHQLVPIDGGGGS